ncbi:Replication protein A 70 kDa DNA-binding subunit B [Rhynchospora pubera]|uniref:Replication protein A 70 kDa DNA-binding subunit B n=1 Tax=Rhynchospora pubera TaxID=906938 RepID=A0AAV8H1E0_9POAL|nr:Replication protein A 70 kDa DNA-binding subunit B [Rhynchospora pubera]
MVEQEKKIVPLSLLTNKLDRPRIVARVLKIWHACNPLTGIAFDIDFTLIDAEGTAIQGTMAVDDSDVILQEMHEGNVYEFYLFRVIPARKKYCAVSHNWQVKFNRAVVLKPVSVSDRYQEIPFRFFNFCQFEELGKQIVGEHVVVDAIGRINRLSAIREVVKDDVVVYVRTVEIANERNTTVPISLWGEHINELKEELTIKSHPTVVAISSLRLRLFPGQVSANLKPVIAGKLGKADSLNASNSDYVKLDHLLSLDPEQEKNRDYKCIATVEEVLGEQDWYYKSCPRDKKRLKRCQKDGYKCPKCYLKINEEQTVPRLRLCISVKDSTASVDFVILGRRVEHLLGVTTQQLLHAQRIENQFMPSKIQALINRTVLFTVRCCAYPVRYNYRTFNVCQTDPTPRLPS